MKNKELLELIKDKRLTPTMRRIRAGATQLFREINSNDRTFISKTNCDVMLTHKKRSMYAVLIEGEWYWAEGCAECLGLPRDWSTYIECEKHDRCSVCGINRKDLNGGISWDNKDGWICNKCNEIKRAQVRKQAFDRLNGKEPECGGGEEIICPHCGTKISSDDIYESQKLYCETCGGEFDLEVEFNPIYSTSVIGERIKE